ncbi:hypothetical protein AGMMS50230_20190 [Spirochaetia bacterium]|nr:hypothetical protein AGMMS50230_20190 [Spirochaetia bacterium]
MIGLIFFKFPHIWNCINSTKRQYTIVLLMLKAFFPKMRQNDSRKNAILEPPQPKYILYADIIISDAECFPRDIE